MQVYIAAPLFNPVQIEQIVRIERVLRDACHEIFSPRNLTASSGGKIENAEHARAVKEGNKAWLRQADTLLAVLNYPRQHGQSLHVIEPAADGPSIAPVELKLPDAGVCWEMGYFEGLIDSDSWHAGGDETLRSIVCFFPEDDFRPNVMLVEGWPVIQTWAGLTAWADGGNVKPYKGETV